MALANEAQSFQRNRPLSVDESSVETDAYVIENSVPSAQAPRWAMRLVGLYCIGALLFMPIFFGGVHQPVYLIFRTVTFVTVALCVIFGWERLRKSLSGAGSRLVVWSAFAFALFACCQAIVFSTVSREHPVVPRLSALVAPGNSWDAILEIFAFLAVFVLFRFYLCPNRFSHHGSSYRSSSGPPNSTHSGSTHSARWLSHVVTACAIVICFIALSHWFYDTGRLFWTFEPEHIGVSNRARWPFVNPNHLGHLLLLMGFLTLGFFLKSIPDFKNIYAEKRSSLNNQQANFITIIARSKSLQRSLVSILCYGLTCLTVVITILATLSRGTWFGLAIGVFLFATLGLRKSSRETPPFQSNGSPPEEQRVGSYSQSPGRQSRRRRRSNRIRTASQKASVLTSLFSFVSRNSRALVLLIGFCFLCFFMFGQGGELFLSRVDYGLMYSKDDMRWQLYQDTIAMIKQHLWFGVGLGAWASVYPEYMSAQLTGITPVYLHSDSLQILAELGLIGASLVGGLFLFAIIQILRLMRSIAPQFRLIPMAGVCAAIALFTAACLDFPFRIPAINLYFALVCAITSFYIDFSPLDATQNNTERT